MVVPAVGAAIFDDQGDFVLVTVPGPPGHLVLYLTCGVLRDIRQEQLAALNVCNEINQGGAPFACFLHDAEAGWDILAQSKMPVALAFQAPQFFSSAVKGLPGAIEEMRPKFASAELAGERYQLSREDVGRLFFRSMM